MVGHPTKVKKYKIQKYVPCTFNEDGTIQDPIEELPFGGDQLTIERAKNCQLAMLDGESKYDQISALLPKFEDWHLKKTLYEVRGISNKFEHFNKNTIGLKHK